AHIGADAHIGDRYREVTQHRRRQRVALGMSEADVGDAIGYPRRDTSVGGERRVLRERRAAPRGRAGRHWPTPTRKPSRIGPIVVLPLRKVSHATLLQTPPELTNPLP